MREHVFTFVSERAGSTRVEQYSGSTLRSAIRAWLEHSATNPRQPLDFEQFDDGWRPASLDATVNAWFFNCTSADDVPIFVNVVATVANAIDSGFEPLLY